MKVRAGLHVGVAAAAAAAQLPGLTAPSLQLEPWLCRAYLEGVQREGVSSLDTSSLSLCLSSSNSLYDDLEHFLDHFLMEVEQPA